MNFYAGVYKRNPKRAIRVHPLLLSLAEAINLSERHPNIGTISEGDERALRSDLYTSPSTLPPLEIHFLGQNRSSLLSNQIGLGLTSVVGCRECVPPSPQDNSGGEGNATQGNLAATPHAMEEISVHTRSSPLSTRKSGKKRRRASSGAGHGSPPNTRGPTAARVLRRPKGLQPHLQPQEGKTQKSSDEVRDWEEEPRMFTEGSAQHIADDIR